LTLHLLPGATGACLPEADSYDVRIRSVIPSDQAGLPSLYTPLTFHLVPFTFILCPLSSNPTNSINYANGAAKEHQAKPAKSQGEVHKKYQLWLRKYFPKIKNENT
jgi:hypothetical protein